MKIKNIIIVLVVSLFFSACAVVDKTLAPVDNVINSTKTTYDSIGNSTGETFNDLSNSVNSVKAGFYENSFVQLFSADDTIVANRRENFVSWSGASKYNARKIIKNYLKKSDSDLKEKDLEVSQKMTILKDYFFELKSSEYRKDFESKYSKVEFDHFLTDRENIENIYKYKSALREFEHEWNMNIYKTQKEVAHLMLSTLYAQPSLKFISYNPYDDELFLLLSSQQNGFKEKIKVSVEKELAREFKDKVKVLQATIYYKMDSNHLKLVGVDIFYKGNFYLADFVDTTYSRKSDIVFTSNGVNLKQLDVDYTEVIQDIEPPEWYLNIKQEHVGYGQGMDLDEARTNAYKNIAQSQNVKVNTKSSLSDSQHGSLFSSSINNKTDLETQDVVVKNSKTLKEEKKDGIWFVAISY